MTASGAGHTTFNGRPALELGIGESRALILEYGAHVASWVARGREQLYLSPAAEYVEGRPIRGGIPICFPQFDLLGSLPKHGFARTISWGVDSLNADADHATAVLSIVDNDAIRAMWPHAFRLSLTVRLTRDDLDLSMAVENSDADAFEFTGALHTYFRVDDAEASTLQGLEGCAYRDHRTGVDDRHPTSPGVKLSAIGRTYQSPADALELRGGEHAFSIAGQGFENVVVWNPGADLNFHDLPPDGWRRFVCVEAAQVQRPIRVEAGQRWTGGQRLYLI